MKYHVLNGDSLYNQFNKTELDGEIVICREALIDGPLASLTLEEFWQVRAIYQETVKSEYLNHVKSEFDRIINAPAGSEFNLWFGYDLFCQANLWFILSLISDNKHSDIYIIYPFYFKEDKFGVADKNDRLYCFDNRVKDLTYCFNNRIKFEKDDLVLARDLWVAFKNHNLSSLKSLSETQSPCFPNLAEVCKAHIDRFIYHEKKSRPEAVIEDIVTNISNDFNRVFPEFVKREGIYGFGDVQLKKIYDKVVNLI